MSDYLKANQDLWSGRKSDQTLYLHEKVEIINIENLELSSSKQIVVMGYACDEGVKRNQGRIGAVDGPDAIRTQLGKMPNHLSDDTVLLDAGTIHCQNGDLELAQENLAKKVTSVLENKAFPILLGGGHDIAYAHYNGIKNSFEKDETIGIINFDAHFDLRANEDGNNSGTPFYQIAKDCEANGDDFKYLCLGIRKDANDKILFETADKLRVKYVENTNFKSKHAAHVVREVLDFISDVDYVYVTIDLDGFSSAYAPGVSAPSPMGFSPEIVVDTLQMIFESKKLISLDLAEMNPKYDIDNQTAKLAASLIHFAMHSI
jgi:formiminoglutamase